MTQLIKENLNKFCVYYMIFHGCVICRFPFWFFYTIKDKETIIHLNFERRQCIEHRPKLLKQ